MKQTFDPNDPAALEAALADLADDEVALRPAFRDQLLADAAQVTAPAPSRPWARVVEWFGLAGLPAAALAGAWLGVANPTLILQANPWDASALVEVDEDDALLADIFGESWVSLEDVE